MRVPGAEFEAKFEFIASKMRGEKRMREVAKCESSSREACTFSEEVFPQAGPVTVSSEPTKKQFQFTLA